MLNGAERIVSGVHPQQLGVFRFDRKCGVTTKKRGQEGGPVADWGKEHKRGPLDADKAPSDLGFSSLRLRYNSVNVAPPSGAERQIIFARSE